MAVAAAAGALGAVAAAPPAGAAAPVGRVIASGLPWLPVVDDETGRIAFETTPGVVRVVDPRTGMTRDSDVSGSCARDDGQGRVSSAADGAVLLICTERRSPRLADGSENAHVAYLPRILDGADWTVKVPVNAERASGMTRLVRAGIVSRYEERDGFWETVLDWRTGTVSPWHGLPCSGWRVVLRGGRRALAPAIERCDGGGRAVLPIAPGNQPGSVEHGFASWTARGIEDTMPLTGYLPDCRLLLRWEVGAIATVEHLPEALLISDTGRGNGPLTVTRVPLDGACARIGGRWELRASARGRTVAASVRAGTAIDTATGAETALLARAGRAALLRVRAGGSVRLRTGAAARGVRWRTAGGRWQAARGSGRAWRLSVPPHLRGTRTIEFETRLADGGVSRQAVRVARVGRG